jgi:hypothetical protein
MYAFTVLILLFIMTGARAADMSPPETAMKAQEILEQRCIVCHGCYDAPCQLKMEAHEGLVRGASKALVYDSKRLSEAEMTRLFDDAHSERQWRKKGFYPALNSGNPKDGTLYRMLQMKQAHPLDTKGPLPEGFDFALRRDQQCPKPEEFDQFQQDYPLWGMPYGLPGLNTEEHQTLITWLEQGAPSVVQQPLTGTEREAIVRWESFLNGDDKKHRLMSRYIYEHLFLANLYLEESDDPTWFRLVRSRSAPGEPLKLISTRRPYDDPGNRKFYYRLQRMEVKPLRKIHMPYRFDQTKRAWYQQLFLTPDYTITKLPGYGGEDDANPFHTFRDIPVRSRYAFLLEEAQFTIMSFIKGPVCRGRVALSVINEHFWVMFEDPDLLDPGFYDNFLAQESDNLRLPQAKTGTAIDILTWRRYAKAQERYLKSTFEAAAALLQENEELSIDYGAIWDGDGHNPNAALTIFRHFNTASVVKGFVGQVPKTAWVIDYPLLERISYLLVAGYDVYGAVSHQLDSRLYMDFLRVEGELGFLLFMPDGTRQSLAEYWYRDAPTGIVDHIAKANVAQGMESSVDYKTDNAKVEFLRTLRGRIYGAENHRYDYHSTASAAMTASFEQLENLVGAHNQFMPSVSFVNVVSSNRDEVYTIIRSSGYSNIAQMWGEDKRRLYDEDKLTIVSGFIGAYPNQFFQVTEGEIERFSRDIGAMKTAADYAILLERYGVARNAPWFWRISDKMHRLQAQDGVLESGLFDYGRYKGY